MKLTIIMPEEEGFIVEFEQDNLPGIAVINQNLEDEKLRKVFRWHASIVIYFDELIINGMPNEKSNQLANTFEDEVRSILIEKVKPIGLWLSNITWNKRKEIIFRVYDPEALDTFLTKKIKKNSLSLDFDYEILDDPNWEKAKWIDDQIKGFINCQR